MNLFSDLALALVGFTTLVGLWLGWQLLRQNGRILLRLEELEKRLNELEFGEGEEPAGLPIGSQPPAFELPDLAGEGKSLAQFRGQPVLLIFFNPDCGFCREMMPKLAVFYGVRRQAERDAALGQAQGILDARERPKAPSSFHSARALQNNSVQSPEGLPPQVLIISTGEVETNRQLFAEHSIGFPVLLQSDEAIAKAYQANGTPSGCLVSADGKIASQLAIGAEALLNLANGGPYPQPLSHPMGEGGQGPGEGDRTNRFGNRSLGRSRIKRDGLRAGTPAPDFRLPRLDGCGELSLSELHGKRVVLVFSSPHCGPCNTLAPELEKFHRQHPEMELIMISKGEAKENRAKVREHGLTFPIVLQQQWEISRRYAMFATPIAYLIDEAGVLAHDVAVGADGILELLARAKRASDEEHAMAST